MCRKRQADLNQIVFKYIEGSRRSRRLLSFLLAGAIQVQGRPKDRPVTRDCGVSPIPLAQIVPGKQTAAGAGQRCLMC